MFSVSRSKSRAMLAKNYAAKRLQTQLQRVHFSSTTSSSSEQKMRISTAAKLGSSSPSTTAEVGAPKGLAAPVLSNVTTTTVTNRYSIFFPFSVLFMLCLALARGRVYLSSRSALRMLHQLRLSHTCSKVTTYVTRIIMSQGSKEDRSLHCIAASSSSSSSSSRSVKEALSDTNLHLP